MKISDFLSPAQIMIDVKASDKVRLLEQLSSEAAAATGLGERIGLRGMRERITLLGGRWSLQSRPGSGTLIVAEIPLPMDEGATGYGT